MQSWNVVPKKLIINAKTLFNKYTYIYEYKFLYLGIYDLLLSKNGKYILFFDKIKSDIVNFFLNHKQSGYWVLYNQMTSSFVEDYLNIIHAICWHYVNDLLG
jgi:hypothetical protein